MRPARPPLDRLLDHGAVADLLRAGEASLPGVSLTIELADAAAGGDAAGGDAAGGDAAGGVVRRVLRAGGVPVGVLVGRGPVTPATLDLLGVGLELALSEASARRGLALEALEAYRELSLLYRVAETIGSTLDAATIGPSILFEAQRVLRCDAAVVLPTADETGQDGHDVVVPAEIGPRHIVERLIAAGRSLVEGVERSGGPELSSGEPGEAGASFGSMLAAPLRTAAGCSA